MQVPRFTVRRLMAAVAVLAVGLALFVVLARGPEEAGAAEAERDIAAGKLCLKTYGLPAFWFGDYAKLMKAKLGVEVRPVAGCVVTEQLQGNVEGYNRRMTSEIARRFGAGAVDRIVAEAEAGAGAGAGVAVTVPAASP